MWRMIVYAIGIIFQIVILILMIKEARKDRMMRKTGEYLIDELKKRKSEVESLDYQRAVEDTEYCERHEPTYNPDDGSM